MIGTLARRLLVGAAITLIATPAATLGARAGWFGGGGVALAEAPGRPAFERTWARTDRPVAEGVAARTWMWGPQANTPVLREAYAEAPGEERVVQYFDKSRMEISDPDGDQSAPWYVTNGLLVVELVTGRMQVGDADFVARAPAEVNVAGDADDPTGPTYATFTDLRDATAGHAQPAIVQRVSRDGTISVDESLALHGAGTAHFVAETQHWLADPFWTFMSSSGPVYVDGQYVSDTLFENPFYATGFPITDPYWASVKVDGSYRDVLLQCFERRCLTYTPGNPAGFLVEAGNVGQHYFAWRYGDGGSPTPTPPPDDVPVAGDVLYESTLSDWPEDTSGDNAIGFPAPDGAGYTILTNAGAAWSVLNAGEFGDASYSVDVRAAQDFGDAGGCLVVRTGDLGMYYACAEFSDGMATGTLSFHVGQLGGALTELATFTYTPLDAAAAWQTIAVIADGHQFWFFANDAYVGTATHAGSLNGLAGIGSINRDDADGGGVTLTNLVIRSVAP
jgi:hypothetical protein